MGCKGGKVGWHVPHGKQCVLYKKKHTGIVREENTNFIFPFVMNMSMLFFKRNEKRMVVLGCISGATL